MAKYEDDNGIGGQVENNPYCMDKSWQARNVKDMNEKMGYHDMSDLANTATPPTKMTADSQNKQLSPELPNPRNNGRSERP